MALAIIDADFPRYSPIVPNLECAKLSAYWKKRNEFISLIDEIDLVHYSKIFYRKDYDDGDYPPQLGDGRIEIGGRAFSPASYRPLPLQIETTIPDVSIYERYADLCGNSKYQRALFKKLINAQHARISLDGRTVWDDFEKAIDPSIGRLKPIILHDYNLNAVDGSWEALAQHCGNGTSEVRRIGIKFPTRASKPEELTRWIDFSISPGIFNFHYDALMSDLLFDEVARKNVALLENLVYNIGEEWKDEDHFVECVLPRIFLQAAYLHKKGRKIPLLDENQKIICPELKTSLSLINGWCRWKYQDSLAAYVMSCKVVEEKGFSRAIPTEEARKAFRYIGHKNPELFKWFYTVLGAELRGENFEPKN